MTRDVKSAINKVVNEKQGMKETSLVIRNFINRLKNLEMLVPEELDEKQKYLRLFHEARAEDSTFGVYLVLTRNCQLKCPYCFEQGIEQNMAMDCEMADNIVRWCQEYLDNHKNCKRFRVVLYGGEPLLNKKVIRHILPKLHALAKNRNLLFEIGILTNGELLEVKTVSFLKHYKLDRVQITLDGPKDIHDKRRVRKDGSGTFDKITKNILVVLEKNLVKKIHLRINFDRQNINAVPLLFDFFSTRNIQDRIELSFGVITSTISKEGKQKISDSWFNNFGLSQKENASKYLWLCQEAKKRGFNIPQEYLAGPWCTARAINSAVIEPDGSLLKCISTVGRKEFVFGNISSVKDTYDFHFNNFSYLEKCLSKECPFVPICGGGCRFNAYVDSGSLIEPHCQRELIETINKGLIKLSFG
ncbi:MAG: SPASM domain-containing protein [Patescibacteria group bacterium]|nr:SPASM domain-containing protein [Patescibacteria group bacterium]